MNATSARCNASTSILGTAFWLVVSLALLLSAVWGMSSVLHSAITPIIKALGGH